MSTTPRERAHVVLASARARVISVAIGCIAVMTNTPTPNPTPNHQGQQQQQRVRVYGRREVGAQALKCAPDPCVIVWIKYEFKLSYRR